MSKLIFTILSVQDLDCSKRFCEPVGTTVNPAFSDHTAACIGLRRLPDHAADTQ